MATVSTVPPPASARRPSVRPRSLPEWLLVLSCLTGVVAFALPWWSSAQRWAFWRGDQQAVTSGWSLVAQDHHHVLLALPALFLALIAVLAPIQRAGPAGAARWARLPLALGAALTALAGAGLAAGDQAVAMLTVRSVVEIRLGLGGLLTAAASAGVLVAGWWLVGRHAGRDPAT